MFGKDKTRDRICEDLLDLGLRPGGVAMVHSSLRSLGRVPGGPEIVVRGFLDALGPEGTLLMPALSFESVHPLQTRFDVRRTRSCVGAITEHFRTRPGVLRSVHATHSVCGLGRQAAAMFADHHLDATPVGEHSPFRRLPRSGGQIVMLGCGLRPNTSMHGVEELVGPPYLLGGEATFTLIHADGAQTTIRSRTHSFVGWRQRYDRLAHVLEGEELRIGRVLEATVHVIDASALWRRVEAVLRADPLYFVERM